MQKPFKLFRRFGASAAPAPVTLQRLTITAPASVGEGSSATLTVTGHYSNGSDVLSPADVKWSDNAPGGVLAPAANSVHGDGYQATVTAAIGSVTTTALVTIVDTTVVSTPVITPPIPTPTPTPTTPALPQWDGAKVRFNFYGDSNIQLGYPDDLSTLIGVAYGPTNFVVDNQGHAGDRMVPELLDRYSQAVTQTSLATAFLNYVLVMGGVNDALARDPIPLDTLVAAAKKICLDTLAQGSPVIIMTVLHNATPGVQPRIDAYNARLQNEAPGWGAKVYDAANEPGLTDPTNKAIYADETHLTPLGKHYLARGLKRVLDPLLIARGVPIPAYTWDIDSLPAPAGIRITGPLPYNRDYVTYQQNPPLPFLDRIRRPGGDYDGDPGDPGEPLQFYGQRLFPTDVALEAFQPGMNPVLKQVIIRDGRTHGTVGEYLLYILRGVRADGSKVELLHYTGRMNGTNEQPFTIAPDPSFVAFEHDNRPTRVPSEIVLICEYTPVAPDVVPQAQTFGLGAQTDQDIKTYSILLDPNPPHDQSRPYGPSYDLVQRGVREFVAYDDFGDLEAMVFEQMRQGGGNQDALGLKLKADGKLLNLGMESCPRRILDTYPVQYYRDDQGVIVVDNQGKPIVKPLDSERNPIPYGADPNDPQSYELLMQRIRQIFYRYGANKTIPDSWLTCLVAPFYKNAPEAGGFTFQKGLGIMGYFSPFNENDGNWKEFRSQFPGAVATPRATVALMTKVYDELKPLYPEVIFMPPGMSSPTPDYLKEMYYWAEKTRGRRADGKIDAPWDAIEIHTYPDGEAKDELGRSVPRGMPIEGSTAARDLELLFRAKKLFMDDVEIVVGEIGRDTSRYSPNSVVIPTGSTQTAEEYAGVLAVRDALYLEQLGVKRTQHYIMYPDTPDEYTKFHFMGWAQQVQNPTTGIIEVKLLPKGALLTQLNQLFGDFYFARQLSASPIVVERRNSAGKALRSYHYGTKTNQTGTYTETIPAAGATLYELDLHTTTPKRTPLAAGAYPVKVSETVVFILFN
ncbi:MAG: SGNH/GDSL hydrolase family protein [Janthinobacterium lividum]